MKTIKGNHKAEYAPIADLVTYRAMPTRQVKMNQLDPFIFLNHHGWQEYSKINRGLPFGPHPHRGFETVTFILEGDLVHKDSSGASSVISAGGVQWMTAGSGLVHAEISSDEFKKNGGALEILQLWVNLPAKYKMVAPHYTGLQKEEIRILEWDNGNVVAGLVSGMWDGKAGGVNPLTDVHLSCIRFTEGGKHVFSIDPDKSILFYVVKGKLLVNGERCTKHHLLEFNQDGKVIEIKAVTDSIILFGYATPFHESFVAYGPFVMNTEKEIEKAYEDYNAGKFGSGEISGAS